MIFKREPAAILAVVQAIIALAIGFGLDVNQEQFALIMAASAAILGLITRQAVAVGARDGVITGHK